MPLLTRVVPSRRAQFHSLPVQKVERLTDDAVAVSFAVPQALRDAYRFEAGQHLTLRAAIDGEDVRQSYSICQRADGRAPATVRVASAVVDGGRMSTWLNAVVAPGDSIEVMTPTGSFTCPVTPGRSRHHVAVAAGSGITPVLALVSTALASEPGSQVTLLFGNRTTSSVMFLEELEDLKNRYPARFQLVNVLSREPQDVDLFHGRLDPDRLAALFAALLPGEVSEVDEWYLCGPFGLVTGAQSLLADCGVDPSHVHHEVFHVDEASDTPRALPRVVDASAAPEATVTVTLDGRTTQVVMPSRDESILDATLRARPDAPFSCTNGVCGTCRARVVAGEVRMDRNYALEPGEVAAGMVLACQAHPVSASVTLEYDV